MKYTDPSGHVPQILLALFAYLTLRPDIGPAVTNLVMHPELIEVGLGTVVSVYQGVEAVKEGRYEDATLNFLLAGYEGYGLKQGLNAAPNNGKINKPIDNNKQQTPSIKIEQPYKRPNNATTNQQR